MSPRITYRVLVSADSFEPAYLSRTPQKGARLSFWTTPGLWTVAPPPCSPKPAS
ncbi:hypothetical protein F5X96DRAFT_577403 [Biscogniauxia mediterranea]|nr:hypothetical protein F5X96DRAFT_577403 [Biscogniauxia mediterranea]